MQFQFSGHESFICKHFWLKKGYDFITKGGSFNDESSVIDLGVGKNMVASIAYWLRAFGISDQNNKRTQLGHYLFNDKNGKDRYIESIGTLWLLHYSLIKTNKASIYNIFFNEFRRGRIEFTKEHLKSFIVKKAELGEKVNPNTVLADITVFIRNYLSGGLRSAQINIEDDFSNLLLDLDLMHSYQLENAEGKKHEWYKVENLARPELPFQIVLYTILDNPLYGKSISFKELLSGHNGPGAVFALGEDGLFQKIEQIIEMYKGVTYKDTAGVRELQFKTKLDKHEVLNDYYEA